MPADPYTTFGIRIALPFTVDICGLNAELFGAHVSLSGDPVTVTVPIARSAIYDLANAKGWINYIQLENEDTFRAYINNSMATTLINAIKGSLFISSGTAYNLAYKGINHIDTSGAWPGINTASANNFHNLQDFILGYFAYSILGHPNALSIIANDPTIRSQATLLFNRQIEKLRGAPGYTFNTVPTNAQILEGNLDATGSNIGIDASGLQAVVQQVMNLDPARFQEDSKGVLRPVPFYTGDVIEMQMSLRNNKYKLHTNNPTLYLKNFESNDPASSIAPNGALSYDIPDRLFVFKFVIGE